VGDRTTDAGPWVSFIDDGVLNGRVLYLSPVDQLPFEKKIGRKHIGYLAALQRGAEGVYDFDEDTSLQFPLNGSMLLKAAMPPIPLLSLADMDALAQWRKVKEASIAMAQWRKVKEASVKEASSPPYNHSRACVQFSEGLQPCGFGCSLYGALFKLLVRNHGYEWGRPANFRSTKESWDTGRDSGLKKGVFDVYQGYPEHRTPCLRGVEDLGLVNYSTKWLGLTRVVPGSGTNFRFAAPGLHGLLREQLDFMRQFLRPELQQLIPAGEDLPCVGVHLRAHVPADEARSRSKINPLPFPLSKAAGIVLQTALVGGKP